MNDIHKLSNTVLYIRYVSSTTYTWNLYCTGGGGGGGGVGGGG